MGRGLTTDELKAFLAQPYLAMLGTVREDGGPYVVPVWHEYDGEALYIVARERSQYVTHIRRDPRVAVAIVGEGTQVLILGQATIVEGPTTQGRWVEIALRMAERYGGEDGLQYLRGTLDRPRYLIRITPEKITSWQGEGWHPRYHKGAQADTAARGDIAEENRT